MKYSIEMVAGGMLYTYKVSWRLDTGVREMLRFVSEI
jgi:hypothetical protein